MFATIWHQQAAKPILLIIAPAWAVGRGQKRATESLQPFDFSGSPGRARTAEPVIFYHFAAGSETLMVKGLSGEVASFVIGFVSKVMCNYDLLV